MIGKGKFYKLKAILIIIFLITILIGKYIYNSKYTLTESFYTIFSSNISEPIRITHLTDLHNSKFRDDNKQSVLKVKEEHPDIILITGDILNYNEENTKIAVSLISEL